MSPELKVSCGASPAILRRHPVAELRGDRRSGFATGVNVGVRWRLGGLGSAPARCCMTHLTASGVRRLRQTAPFHATCWALSHNQKVGKSTIVSTFLLFGAPYWCRLLSTADLSEMYKGLASHLPLTQGHRNGDQSDLSLRCAVHGKA